MTGKPVQAPGTDPAYECPEDFASLERRASKPADAVPNTLDTDLATLRESSGMLADLAEAAGCNSVDVDETRAPLIEALDRVEAELSRLREERDALMRATWRCYVVSGADPDGNDRWHTSAEMACKASVDAVEQLRSDYNEALDENRAAEARCARLQQALGAYRSALRSGEPESERMRQMGDEALAGPDTPADSQPEASAEGGTVTREAGSEETTT